jgi:L-ascorbate metabolism protein UlaG (beta-lactamase superfamily)
VAAPAAHSEEPEGCPGLIASAPALVMRATHASDEVSLTFIGHSTFLIETPQGVRIATDYNDYVRAPAAPRIATMNKAHSTHFSRAPEPGIEHVLRGWNPAGGPAHHDLTVGMSASGTSQPTSATTVATQNSTAIRSSSTARLCIAHLGHLHHTLRPEHLKKLGRIDVLLVPVDGGYTMQAFDMMEVLRSVNAPLMLPMHYFNRSTLERFLAQARQHYLFEFSDKPLLVVSHEALPKSPTVLVLPGH